MSALSHLEKLLGLVIVCFFVGIVPMLVIVGILYLFILAKISNGALLQQARNRNI